jgi:hypothetical protein
MSEEMLNEIPANEQPVVPPAEGEPPVIDASPKSDYDWKFPEKEESYRDPLNPIFWAAMLIMAGLIFLADNLQMLPTLNNASPWDWIMLSAGALILIASVIRALIPSLGGPNFMGIIIGMVLLGLGVGAVFAINLTFSQWWPVVLIILGLSALSRAMRR